MTLEGLKAQLIARCGNRKQHGDILEAEIGYAIEQLEEDVFHPWFLLSNRKKAATITGDERILLPMDFIATYEEGTLWLVIDGQRIPLTKITLDEINSAEEASGQPEYFTVTGDLIRFYPTPNAVYEVEMLYYQKSGTVDDSNVWLRYASQYVGAVAMFNYATNMRDKNLLRLAGEQREIFYNRLLARHTEQAMSDRDLVKGD